MWKYIAFMLDSLVNSLMTVRDLIVQVSKGFRTPVTSPFPGPNPKGSRPPLRSNSPSPPPPPTTQFREYSCIKTQLPRKLLKSGLAIYLTMDLRKSEPVSSDIFKSWSWRWSIREYSFAAASLILLSFKY